MNAARTNQLEEAGFEWEHTATPRRLSSADRRGGGDDLDGDDNEEEDEEDEEVDLSEGQAYGVAQPEAAPAAGTGYPNPHTYHNNNGHPTTYHRLYNPHVQPPPQQYYRVFPGTGEI